MIVESNCQHEWKFVGEDIGGRVHWCSICGAIKDSSDEVEIPDCSKPVVFTDENLKEIADLADLEIK